MTLSFDPTARMLEWPSLTGRSVVLDIGAFEGSWASRIAALYHPAYMYLFEPQSSGSHLNRLRDSMAAIPYDRYQVLPYGLGDANGVFPMVEALTDGASFVKQHGDPGRNEVAHGTMIDAHDWLAEFRESHDDIDLASINIEGYEYDLLPYLVSRGDIGLFGDLAVQFHLFVDKAEERYVEIRRQLAQTHDLLWECFPTWVTWRRKVAV